MFSAMDGNSNAGQTGDYAPPTWAGAGVSPNADAAAEEGSGNAAQSHVHWGRKESDDYHHHMSYCDDDCDASAIQTVNTLASSVFSHLTDVTDYEATERNYRASSLCTEAVEERGLKDPLGFCIICSVVLVGEMSRGITFPTLWLFVESLGGTTVTMGWCVAAFSFGRVVTSPLFGHLSVTWGYKVTLLIAGTFLLLGAFLYALAQTVGKPEFLILAQSILGVGSGTLGVTRAYVAEVTPKGLRTRYLAYLAAVMYSGFTVTPFLGAALVWCFRDGTHVVNRGIFIIDMYTAPALCLMLVCITNLCVLFFLLKHRRRELMPKVKKKVSSKAKAAAEVPPAVAVGQSKTACGISVFDCVIWFVVLLNIVSKGCISTYETLGVKLAEDIFNIESTAVGVTLGSCGIIGVLLLLSFKTLSRYLADVHLISGGLLISVVGITSMTEFGFGGEMGLGRFIVGFFFVFGIGFPISDTAIVGMFSKVVGNKPQGTLQGLLACSSAISRMAVPVLASYVSQYLSMTVLFVGINIVLLLSAGLVYRYGDLLKTLSS